MADLGAESLDFLDIVFKLERAFDIQITRGEMERAARGDMSEDEFAPRGVLSPAGLERLRTLMPEARERIQPGLRPVQILSLFSVQTSSTSSRRNEPIDRRRPCILHAPSCEMHGSDVAQRPPTSMWLAARR